MSSAEVEHGPGLTDSEGRVRCQGCGFIHPCPTARSLPRPLEAEEWDLLRSLDLDVGFAIYRREPEGAEVDPVGGVVVGSYDDNGATTFRIIDFPRGRHRYRTLRLADIEPATVGLPNAAVARGYARRLAAFVGKQKGTATGEEVELLSDALRLLTSIT